MIPRRPKLARILHNLLSPWEKLINWLFGPEYNPTYKSGVLALFCLALVMVSGIPLLFFYKISTPYESISWIHSTWFLGWLRGLHRYASDAAIVAIFFHLLRMLQAGRTSGPRARAWISGLLMVVVLIAIGVFGLILVWDTQGQKLAVQGLRFIEGLPLFSDRIGRIFADNQELGGSFFFILVFLHIALPLLLAFLFLMHTSRVARVRFWPEPHLLRSYGLALLLLSLVVPVPLAEAANLLHLPGRIPLDYFYGFWLPVMERVGPVATLLIFGGIFLVLASIPWWWAKDGPGLAQASVVDEASCTGCTQCVQDCPYGAIAMVKRRHFVDGKHSDMVALVNPDLCTSCGICAGSCAPMAVGPPTRTGREQVRAIDKFASSIEWKPGDIVLLACRWGSGESAAWQNIAGVHCYPTGCCGSVHTSAIESFLRKGATGVFVLSCPERDCSHREGPKWLNLRVYEDREAELQARVDRRRVRLFACPGVDLERARAQVLAFHEEMIKLHDVKAMEDSEIRCRTSEIHDDVPEPENANV